MKTIIQTILFSLLISKVTYATVYNIRASRDYINPDELYSANVVTDRETILIDGEDYIGSTSLAVWTENDLFILGIGGRPHLIADGADIWGKGIWVLARNNI